MFNIKTEFSFLSFVKQFRETKILNLTVAPYGATRKRGKRPTILFWWILFILYKIVKLRFASRRVDIVSLPTVTLSEAKSAHRGRAYRSREDMVLKHFD